MNNHPDGQPNLYGDRVLSDLEWTAFCFLTDELDSIQRESFEAALEHDVAACEALAAMTELLRLGSLAKIVSHGGIAESQQSPKSLVVNREQAPCDSDPNFVSEPEAVYALTPDKFERPTFPSGKRPTWRLWTTTCAIVLLALTAGFWSFRNSTDAIEPVAEAWAVQLDDADELPWSADGELTDPGDDNEVVVDEGDEDWLFTALVSLEEWSDGEQGDGT